MRELNEWEQRHYLVRNKLDEADPIWGQAAHVYDTYDGAWFVSSDRSGSFKCPPRLREYISSWPLNEKATLTSWINNQNISGVEFPRLTRDIIDNIQGMKPLRFRAKIDRFFEYLSSVGYRPGDYVFPSHIERSPNNIPIEDAIMRWVEATSDRELRGILSMLASEGLIEDRLGSRLTAKGFSRLDELDAAGAGNDQAFVAMWFDATMEQIYEEAINPAITEAGYKPFRIDRKEHANKIDDEIVAEIRRSKFLIADFTCGTVSDGEVDIGIPRGGVYYEAGLAQGLGMPVIWAVRQDQINLVHFDTRQFNHIAWVDVEDYRSRLRRRIEAVIGPQT